MTDFNKGMTLRSRIREDYLTCAICFFEFKQPKALPCIHTFCLECLRDYVSSAYQSSSVFPCPVCRVNVNIPPQGLEGLPDNFLVSSLFDTVEESTNKPIDPPMHADEASAKNIKPIPAPRSILPRPQGDGRPVPAPRSVSPRPPSVTPTVPPRPRSVSLTPGHFDSSHIVNPTVQHQMDPSSGYHISGMISDGIGGVVGAVGSALSDISSYLQLPKPPNADTPKPPNADTPTTPFEFVPQTGSTETISQPVYAGLYPQLDTNEDKGPCTKGMVLKFGKFGPGVNDLMKPYGLAVGKSGEFVLSDRGGNRIFVFSNSGELKSRFNINCTINGVAITKENNIMVAVSKSGSSIMRTHSMDGHFLQVFGDYYKFDVSSGITITPSNYVAITNLAADNVLIFTGQRKFSVKFGRKGGGQNHFFQPHFVASTGKDYLVVSDTGNHCIKVYDVAGNFKRSFGSKGDKHNQLNMPLGVATDAEDNIIIADSGNFRVEIFNVKGSFTTTLVQETNLIGPDVQPINVAVTPKNNIAVLLCGTGYCQVRVFTWKPNSHSGFIV